MKKGGGFCGPKDGAQKAAGAASELGLANVGGVFVVLAAGSLIAIIICVAEFVWKMKQIPRSERDHIFVELMRELKHVICCYGSTRPVRRTIDDFAQGIIAQPANGAPYMSFRAYANDFAPPLGLTGKEDQSLGSLRQYPVLVTENSTQSSEPLIERSSPNIHYSQEDDTFQPIDRNYALKHQLLEDNESTDDGGFKNITGNIISCQMKDANNTLVNDTQQQSPFYRFPEGDLVSASDV